MTQVTTDPTTGTTAVLLSPSESGGKSTSGRDQSTGTGSSSQGFDARDRIHRLAGSVHQAIDKIEQSLSSKAQGVSSTQSKYGEQARQYGETAREQITSRPLQAAAIAFGTGVIVDKLFMGKTKERVRVVRVPVQTRSYWDAGPSAGHTARRWTDSARARSQDLGNFGHEAAGKAGAAAGYGLGRASSFWDSGSSSVDRMARRWTDAIRDRGQDLADAGQGAIGKVGAAAGAGLAGTKMMASTLTNNLSTVPLQMRLATQRLLARSQEYGSMTRAGVQAHPMIGLGALAGAGALLTTLWMQRRGTDDSYVGLNERSDSLSQHRYAYSDASSGVGGMIASRPVTSAVVMLGVGALLGALLKRQ